MVIALNLSSVPGLRRQRGRPRKAVSEVEPTQAFLVQTADGQTLMMQVPLSSIPPGISLQEMAQEIANKLNFGLSQVLFNPSYSTLYQFLNMRFKYLNNLYQNFINELNLLF